MNLARRSESPTLEIPAITNKEQVARRVPVVEPKPRSRRNGRCTHCGVRVFSTEPCRNCEEP